MLFILICAAAVATTDCNVNTANHAYTVPGIISDAMQCMIVGELIAADLDIEIKEGERFKFLCTQGPMGVAG